MEHLVIPEGTILLEQEVAAIVDHILIQDLQTVAVHTLLAEVALVIIIDLVELEAVEVQDHTALVEVAAVVVHHLELEAVLDPQEVANHLLQVVDQEVEIKFYAKVNYSNT